MIILYNKLNVLPTDSFLDRPYASLVAFERQHDTIESRCSCAFHEVPIAIARKNTNQKVIYV